MPACYPGTLVRKYQGVGGASMARPGEQPQETNLSLPEEQAVATVASVEEVKKKPSLSISRVQTGVRIEKRMLKVRL